MKFFSAVYCEIILILMISKVKQIDDIIKDFVALGFIVEIDDIFAQNLNHWKLFEEKIEKYNKELVIEIPKDYHKKLYKSIFRCCWKK